METPKTWETNEFPWEVGDVQLPAAALQLGVGGTHICARTQNLGDVICWGSGDSGVLGSGDTTAVGDNELPSTVSPVLLGAEAALLSAGGFHNCVLDAAGRARCWGFGSQGRLGYGNNETIGDDEFPEVAGTVDVDATAVELSAGVGHTCVVLSDGRVQCWGANSVGQLGIGSTATIGDDEPPDTTTPLNFGVGRGGRRHGALFHVRVARGRDGAVLGSRIGRQAGARRR